MEQDELGFFGSLLSDLDDETMPLDQRLAGRAAKAAVESAYSEVEHKKLLDLLEKKGYVSSEERKQLRADVQGEVDRMMKSETKDYVKKHPDSVLAKSFLEGIEKYDQEFGKH
jgi:hypothetical protein